MNVKMPMIAKCAMVTVMLALASQAQAQLVKIVEITPRNAQICDGQSVVLTATKTGGAAGDTSIKKDYIWSGGPFTCAFRSDSCFKINANPRQTTVYKLRYHEYRLTGPNRDTLTLVDESDSVTIKAFNANAGPDIYLCDGAQAVLGGSPTAKDGSGKYRYSWDPSLGLNSTSIANPTAKPKQSTTYTVSVYDSTLNCTVQDQVFVGVMIANAGSDREICAGKSTTLGGSPTATGGKAPYTYEWTPTDFLSNPTIANPVSTPPGEISYLLTVRDANGCESRGFVQINKVNQNPVANAGPDTIVCSGSTVNLGSPNAATGGTPSYTYNWTGGIVHTNGVGQTTAAPGAATLFTLTVTDSKGCQGTDQAFVSVVKSNPGSNKTVCRNQSITLGGNPSGQFGKGPLIYSWSPSTFLSDSTSANPNCIADTTITYNLTVTDQLGCSQTNSVNVNVFRANAGVDKYVCQNQEVVIGLNPGAANGTTPYTYRWSPKTNMNNADTTKPNPRVSPSATRDYVLIAKDKNGCQDTDTVRTIVMFADAGLDTSVCKLDTFRIGGRPSVGNDAIGPYTYNWTVQAGNPANAYIENDTMQYPRVSVNGTITFRVTVNDEKGCQRTDDVVVTAFANLPIANAGPDKNICRGNTTTLGGSGATPTGRGSVAPYKYSWTPGNLTQDSTVSNPTVFPNDTTVFTVLVTDANNCRAKSSARVNVHPKLVADAGADKFICTSGRVQLGGSPTASGGKGPYTYKWDPTTDLEEPKDVANPWAEPNESKAFVVEVTDVIGCKSKDTIRVNMLEANAGPDRLLCIGDTVRIGGNPTALNGNGPFTYKWTPTTGMLDPDTLGNPRVSPSSTGNYSYRVTVTDQNTGCSGQAFVLVKVAAKPMANAGADKFTCAGQAVTIGGSPSASGGAPPYTYLWQPATGIDTVTKANPKAKPTATTEYSLLVTDTNGCFRRDTVLVRVFKIQPDLDKNICFGDSVVLGQSPVVSDGQPAYTFEWSPNKAISSLSASNPKVSPDTTTTYFVKVTDQGGCQVFDTIVVQVNPRIIARAGRDTSICFGQSLNLGGSPAGSGGTGNLTYKWSPSLDLSYDTLSNPLASPGTSRTYTLTVKDSKNCTSSAQINVQVNSLPFITAGKDTTVCLGSVIELGGQPTATGGLAPYTYTWEPGTQLSDPSSANPELTVTQSRVQRLSVRDANLCLSKDSVVITLDAVIANAGSDKTICNGDSVILGGNPTGKSGASFSWTPAVLVNDPSAANPVTRNSSDQMFRVQITHPVTGCTGEDSVLVKVVDTLLTDAGADVEICYGDSVQLSANGGSSFQWTPSAGLNNTSISDPKASPETSTLYHVQGTSGTCVSSDSVRVIVRPLPVVTLSASKDQLCLGESTQLTATGGQTYSWTPSNGLSSSSVSNPTATPQTSTTYTVTVTDNFGCQNQASIHIAVTDTPTLNVIADKSAICRTDSAQLNATGSGTSYSWSPIAGLNKSNVANPKASPLNTTTYQVTATGAASCTSKGSITITVNSNPDLVVNATPAEICQGDSSQLNASGASQYQWTPANSLSNPSIANPKAGPGATTIYTVVGTSGAGCTSTKNVTVTVRNKPVVIASAAPMIVCPKEAVNLSAAGAVTYSWSPSSWLNNPSSANPVARPEASIKYIVTGTDAIGCRNKDSVSITVRAKPTAAFSYTPSAPKDGEPVQFNSGSSVGAVSFDWNFGDPASGASNVSVLANPEHTFTDTGTFTVRLIVTNSEGCKDTMNQTITIKKTGLFLRQWKGDIDIYPNPSSGNIALQLPKATGVPYEISILSASGIEVWRSQWISETQTYTPVLEMDLSQLSQGMYFLNIRHGESLYSGRFIIQRN